MKNYRLGLLAIGISVICVFVTKANTRPLVDYYKFYVDANGNPVTYAGTGEDPRLSGCKFGNTLCGKVYNINDVVETSPGVYEVIAGHEDNQVYTYYRS